MIERSAAKRIRDFPCGGELLTVASGGSASLHYYLRNSRFETEVEHPYPAHTVLFTEFGQWQYHGTEPRAMVGPGVVVAGMGRRQYLCAHARDVFLACFVVAIEECAFEDEGNRLFMRSTVPETPEMQAHRRALCNAVDEPERLEGLAFSLYDIIARNSARESQAAVTDVRMAYAKRLIDERFAHRVRIEEIARELNLSRFTFTRRFLAYHHTSPQAYLSKLRISRAKEQLHRTRFFVDEIAIANGFGSIAHFSSAFRHHVGCSPTAFRRLIAG